MWMSKVENTRLDFNLVKNEWTAVFQLSAYSIHIFQIIMQTPQPLTFIYSRYKSIIVKLILLQIRHWKESENMSIVLREIFTTLRNGPIKFIDLKKKRAIIILYHALTFIY